MPTPPITQVSHELVNEIIKLFTCLPFHETTRLGIQCSEIYKGEFLSRTYVNQPKIGFAEPWGISGGPPIFFLMKILVQRMRKYKNQLCQSA